jgi:hypothetical protein
MLMAHKEGPPMAKFHFPSGEFLEVADKDAPKLARNYCRYHAATIEADDETFAACAANLPGEYPTRYEGAPEPTAPADPDPAEPEEARKGTSRVK